MAEWFGFQLESDSLLEKDDEIATAKKEIAQFLPLCHLGTHLYFGHPIDAGYRHHSNRQQRYNAIVGRFEDDASACLNRLPSRSVAKQVVFLGFLIPLCCFPNNWKIFIVY